MHKTKIFIPIILLCILAGCDSGNGNNSADNFCYLLTSSNPCFDPDRGGSTTTVTDKSVDEVIREQESMQGFEDELPVTDILGGIELSLPGTGTVCSLELNELVIKMNKNWNRFRNGCFSSYKLPDVDFTSSMVLISTRGFAQYDTAIEALLEFDDHLTAVIEDDVSTIPPLAPGYPFDIASVANIELPVDFIRVETDITSTIIN